jgi:hypothetical protein
MKLKFLIVPVVVILSACGSTGQLSESEAQAEIKYARSLPCEDLSLKQAEYRSLNTSGTYDKNSHRRSIAEIEIGRRCKK